MDVLHPADADRAHGEHRAMQTLRERWDAVRRQAPRLRIRDAAQRLGVSEMELLLCDDGARLQRLAAPYGPVMQALASVGRIMTLTRNEHVVHETTGRMGDLWLSADGGMGLCTGEIDLRLFLGRWAHGWSVTRETPRGLQRSLQFFDAAGVALHKVYAVAETDFGAWQALADCFATAGTAPSPAPPSGPSPSPTMREEARPLDLQALLADWAAITDVHQFNALLSRHRLRRIAAVRAAEGRWTRRRPANALVHALRSAADRAVPLMAFVSNPGVVQIHSAVPRRLLATGSWFNIMDPDFNLHVDTAGIDSIWTVRRPSADGDIHSLECFDRYGELMLTLFGERKPGQAERPAWRALLDAIGDEEDRCSTD